MAITYISHPLDYRRLALIPISLSTKDLNQATTLGRVGLYLYFRFLSQIRERVMISRLRERAWTILQVSTAECQRRANWRAGDDFRNRRPQYLT